MDGTLGVVDIVLLVLSLGIGVYFARFAKEKQNSDELLNGKRKLGAWPVAISMLVSSLSGTTILGYPSEIYSYGSQMFFMSFSGIIFYPIGVYLFVQVMYNLNLTSTFQYLELRFQSVLVRQLASFIYILQLLIIGGIVLYAPAIAMETMLNIPVPVSVVLIGISATIYTSIGGIKAVIWTDVLQFVLIMVGMSIIVIKGFLSSGGVSEVFRIADERGRLEFVNWTLDPFMRHNTLNILIGNGFSTLCIVGFHQPMVQRYSGLSSFRAAAFALFACYLMGLIAVILVVITGLIIFAHYANCDPISAGQVAKSDQIVPYFVIDQLATIPGFLGLFITIVFSAVLSTISSSLNCLAAVTWEDFLVKIPWFKKMEDYGQSLTYKIVCVIFGLGFIGSAFVANDASALSIFQATLTINVVTSGIQGSIFIMGMFMPFTNKWGAIAGILSALAVMIGVIVKSILLQNEYSFFQSLPLSVANCSVEIIQRNSTQRATLDWPEKIFSISYILYPVIGGFVAMFVGIVISLAHNCIWRRNEVQMVKPEYLHPLVRSKSPYMVPAILPDLKLN